MYFLFSYENESLLILRLFCSVLKIQMLLKITFYVADDQLSVQVDESGWAWLVHKERLIIWKIGQSPVAKVTERSRWKNFYILH